MIFLLGLFLIVVGLCGVSDGDLGSGYITIAGAICFVASAIDNVSSSIDRFVQQNE